ncbi:MAG: hypothetical protein JNM07_06295 [Phycisphaerae bacterium]|nr:hypothetical protein [Phycisphaerae bacterium]
MRNEKQLNLTLSVFAAGAALLAVFLIAHATGPASANAAPPKDSSRQEPPNPFNSGDQRKQMIDALDALARRMERIESRLEKGVSVKVTELPKGFMAAQARSDGD